MRFLHFVSTLQGILIGFIFLGVQAVRADYITLMAGADRGLTTTYTVPSNVVAQIIYASQPSPGTHSISVSVPSSTNSIFFSTVGWSADGPIFVGPATIALSHNSTYLVAFCTIQTSPALGSSFTPSSSVVIPNDSGGPVTIILESSTDLVTWTAANPGTYGTSSTNRFFRVRAQR